MNHKILIIFLTSVFLSFHLLLLNGFGFYRNLIVGKAVLNPPVVFFLVLWSARQVLQGIDLLTRFIVKGPCTVGFIVDVFSCDLRGSIGIEYLIGPMQEIIQVLAAEPVHARIVVLCPGSLLLLFFPAYHLRNISAGVVEGNFPMESAFLIGLPDPHASIKLRVVGPD